MNQNYAPLYQALIDHKEKGTVSYHVPGHKNGSIFEESAQKVFQQILEIDVTELSGLDDLHAAEGPILQAEELLADFYQAASSYFLVNGSTSGNLAMVMAVCEEGDTVLVQRNCHKSIIHALRLANVNPVFITPSFNEEWGVAGGVEVEHIHKAIAMYPSARALILTHPTYYGEAHSIKGIIEAAHNKEIPVLVDQAHGAHFGLPGFPESAIEAGADIVVHSAHKTLPAMTMGSYLHVNSQLVNKEELEYYLQVFQSSSPSYPIMASLDLARVYLASFNPADTEHLLYAIRQFRVELSEIPGLKIMENDDCLKLTLRSEQIPDGFQFQTVLEDYGIYTELADTENVLLVLPLLKAHMEYPFTETVDKINHALNGREMAKRSLTNPEFVNDHLLSTLSLTYKEMKRQPKRSVSFKESIGCISAEMIIPYPPGIPLLMAGEVITAEKISYMEELRNKGGRFHGGTVLSRGLLLVYG